MADAKQKAIRHFLETQDMAHHLWTFDGETFSLLDIIAEVVEECKRLAESAEG